MEAVGAAGLLSITRASERLGVAEVSVRRWIAAGDLPVVRLGRRVLVDPRDLNAFILARRTRNVPLNGDDPVPTGPPAKETADATGDLKQA